MRWVAWWAVGFEFGPDDLPATFSWDRFFDAGEGKAVLTPFVGRYSDSRPADNVLVPHRAVAAWIVDGTSKEDVRFDVEQLEFDLQLTLLTRAPECRLSCQPAHHVR